MKKLLKKTILYLFIVLLIPYLYFIWQAKQGVDAFILANPTNGKFDYQWLWVDFEGHVILSDITYHEGGRDPVFSIQKTKIILTSIFDLIDAREHVIYKEYPVEVKINMLGGISSRADEFFSLVNISYEAELLDYLYPNKCVTKINKQLPFLNFDLHTQFRIDRTADDSLVNFIFSSRELANIKGKFRINNFSEDVTDGSYLSDLSLTFSDLTWVQQNTQKCLEVMDSDKTQFSQLFSEELINTAKNHQLLLNSDAALLYADFIYVPQKIKLSFDPEVGKTFSQISSDPLYQFQEKLGLKIDLNEKNIGVLFQPDTTRVKKEVNNSDKSIVDIKIEKKDVYLKINRSILRKHLGSKIQINLYNGKKIVGYIEKAYNQSLEIRQLKFKGESILPFMYKDVKSILLLIDTN